MKKYLERKERKEEEIGSEILSSESWVKWREYI